MNTKSMNTKSMNTKSMNTKSSTIIYIKGSFEARDKKKLKYCLYKPYVVKCVTLGIHGGCFQDGNEQYNKGQSESFAKKGIAVMHLDFRQNSVDQTINDLTDAVSFLTDRFNKDKISIIGCSSGGFYSLLLCDILKNKIDCSVSLCPVSDPFKRYHYLKNSNHKNREKMMEKQLTHFKDERFMRKMSNCVRKIETNIPRLVIVGKDDLNVPQEVNDILLKKPIHSFILKGGHELCYRYNEKVTELVSVFLLP
jgi:dipeptidyl aminopeptidase/acylaminoacyl peptidase